MLKKDLHRCQFEKVLDPLLTNFWRIIKIIRSSKYCPLCILFVILMMYNNYWQLHVNYMIVQLVEISSLQRVSPRLLTISYHLWFVSLLGNRCLGHWYHTVLFCDRKGKHVIAIIYSHRFFKERSILCQRFFFPWKDTYPLKQNTVYNPIFTAF